MHAWAELPRLPFFPLPGHRPNVLQQELFWTICETCSLYMPFLLTGHTHDAIADKGCFFIIIRFYSSSFYLICEFSLAPCRVLNDCYLWRWSRLLWLRLLRWSRLCWSRLLMADPDYWSRMRPYAAAASRLIKRRAFPADFCLIWSQTPSEIRSHFKVSL